MTGRDGLRNTEWDCRRTDKKRPLREKWGAGMHSRRHTIALLTLGLEPRTMAVSRDPGERKRQALLVHMAAVRVN